MKNLLVKIYYIFLMIIDFILILNNQMISLIKKPPIVKTTNETINKVINDYCSVSRYGDGEFSIMCGENIIFQPFYTELSYRLREIIKSQQDNHIVCIPNVFESIDWCIEKSKHYWRKYLNLNRNKIYNLIDMKKEYYDALVTRLYIDYEDKSNAEGRFKKLRSLWENRDVVIVEGEMSRLGVGNNLFDNAKLVRRIICPACNAFKKYNEIYNEVKKLDKSLLILIALGPTATVLAYDLSVNGYQGIDIGNIDIEYEWFLHKATEKCLVENKYIGEVFKGTIVGEISDSNYLNQIITKII